MAREKKFEDWEREYNQHPEWKGRYVREMMVNEDSRDFYRGFSDWARNQYRNELYRNKEVRAIIKDTYGPGVAKEIIFRPMYMNAALTNRLLDSRNREASFYEGDPIEKDMYGILEKVREKKEKENVVVDMFNLPERETIKRWNALAEDKLEDPQN
ncbi:hypothetical protein ACFLZZ_03135 [Nanoarchaeota archaeon]